MRFVLRRLVLLVPTLIGVTLVAFVITSAIGDPTVGLLPPNASAAERDAFRQAHGLDRPFHLQYISYVLNVFKGNMGTSIAYQEPVSRLIMRRLPATLELAVAAMVLVVLLGVPMGVLAASARGRWVDHWLRFVALLGQSVATFWLGIMLILVFSVRYRFFPPSGRDSLLSIVLPAITLSAYLLALVLRMTRSGMLDVLGQDYVRTARGKGLGEFAVKFKHGLRNSLIPVVTVLGVQFGNLLSGAIVTETVFSWPGLGLLIVDSIYRRDGVIVQGVVLFMAVTYSLVNLATDVTYGLIDPRVRYQ